MRGSVHQLARARARAAASDSPKGRPARLVPRNGRRLKNYAAIVMGSIAYGRFMGPRPLKSIDL
eukprot:2377662-Prymnesium_polylepis.1